ncbi:MAG TPA: hypothetical protein DDZ80_30150 [Cyanobacteria bacterium UBA8803]|nr:hypothetical protein [Cyanobacteria bacterium UBA9273]HBL62497.1 hypothetical protein [Cyanobacteria bacterium UBA8803]
MICRDFIVYFRDIAASVELRQHFTPNKHEDCLLNMPCGCAKPGVELQCEDCPYLEACLSHFKLKSCKKRTLKQR